MPKLGRPLPFNLVRVRSADEVRQIRARSRRNLRINTASVILILTALFLLPGIPLMVTRKPVLSPHLVPAFIALIFIILLMVGADVLAVMSLVSRRGERFRNRSCALAFALLVISVALVAILGRLLGK
jgi:hypothetical protein